MNFEKDIRNKFIDCPPRPEKLTLWQIENYCRRFWKLHTEQMHRGKDKIESRRIAHAKLAPDLRLLNERDKQAVLTSIELSE